MRLRGATGQGARVRRRKASAAERLASAFGGGREVEFGDVDGVYRAADRGESTGQAMSDETRDRPLARVRPTVHVYTAGGQTRALVGALVGQHIDLRV